MYRITGKKSRIEFKVGIDQNNIAFTLDNNDLANAMPLRSLCQHRRLLCWFLFMNGGLHEHGRFHL